MNEADMENQIRIIKPEDGDLLVVTVPIQIPDDVRGRISKAMANVLSSLGVIAKVVVLDGGMDLKVVRTSELEKSNGA